MTGWGNVVLLGSSASLTRVHLRVQMLCCQPFCGAIPVLKNLPRPSITHYQPLAENSHVPRTWGLDRYTDGSVGKLTASLVADVTHRSDRHGRIKYTNSCPVDRMHLGPMGMVWGVFSLSFYFLSNG